MRGGMSADGRAARERAWGAMLYAAQCAVHAAPRLPERFRRRVLSAAERVLRRPTELPADQREATRALADAWDLYGAIVRADMAMTREERRAAGDNWAACVRAADYADWQNAGIPVIGRVPQQWLPWVLGFGALLFALRRRQYGQA
jgi:hypothetical protein